MYILYIGPATDGRIPHDKRGQNLSPSRYNRRLPGGPRTDPGVWNYRTGLFENTRVRIKVRTI